MKLMKKHLNALGNVFDAEVHGRLPFQSRAAVYKELASNDNQYLEWQSLPLAGLYRVSGYILTHRGRIAYCQACGHPDSE